MVEWSCIFLRINSRMARGASHHPAFMGNCPTISHTFSAISTQCMNLLKWNEDMVQYKVSSYCSCFWCESRESRGRRSLRFPCVTLVVETSSHRVIFRNPSNMNDGTPQWKQSTCSLFPQKSSTTDLRPDFKYGND